MSTGPHDFDPYFKWLGIRPKDQPPTHYRLLGIDLFESDLDVIEQAADRQMAHLRTFQAGPHSQQSQKLLNEVAAARIALLNADEKKRYDAALRQRLDTLARAAPAAAASLSPTPATPASPKPAGPKPTLVAKPLPATPPAAASPAIGAPAIDVRRPVRRKRSSPAVVAAVAAGVAALLFGGMVFRQWRPTVPEPSTVVADRGQKKTTSPAAGKEAKPAAPATNDLSGNAKANNGNPAADEPVAPAPAGDPEPPPVDRGAGGKAAGTSTDPPLNAAAVDSTNTEGDDAGKISPTAAGAPTPPPNTTESPVSSSPSDTSSAPDGSSPAAGGFNRKLPVPDDAAVAEMEAKIREEFKSYFARSKAKNELASRLFDSSHEPPDEPLRRYVLLETARTKAVEAGDVELAGDALEELATRFQIDSVERAGETLTGLAKTAKGPEQATALVEMCRAAIGEARELDRYEAARHDCEIAAAAARKSKDSALAKQFLAEAKQIDEDREAYEAVKSARETLQSRSDDAEANLAVGKFLCFIKGSWREGLEHLARGGDAELKSLADGDLSHPFEAERQVALGDRWWSVAETLPDRQKEQVQAHAAWWYERATATGQLKAGAATAIKKKLAGLAPRETAATRRAARIDRIVLWNEHNSNFNNSGTGVCNVILLRDGGAVWQQNGVRLEWARGRDLSTELSVPNVKADAVRVEVLARIGNSGGLAEVEVYSGDKNLARGCPARASAENANDRRTAATLTDGNTSSKIHEEGYWLLPDGQNGWAEIELQPPARYGNRLAAGGKAGRGKSSREKSAREKSAKLRVTPAVLRKLFHGKASFNSNTGILELAYDFSNKDQLLDFGVTDPDTFQKGSVSVEAERSLRHCAQFLTVSVTGQMMLKDTAGEHLRTTGGVTVRGYQIGDNLSVHVEDREKKLNWTSGGGEVLPQVATAFNLSVTSLAVAWTIPTYTLKVPARPTFQGPTKAGQVELCGGSKGDTFSAILIQGIVDPEWATEFFAEKR